MMLSCRQKLSPKVSKDHFHAQNSSCDISWHRSPFSGAAPALSYRAGWAVKIVTRRSGVEWSGSKPVGHSVHRPSQAKRIRPLPPSPPSVPPYVQVKTKKLNRGGLEEEKEEEEAYFAIFTP